MLRMMIVCVRARLSARVRGIPSSPPSTHCSRMGSRAPSTWRLCTEMGGTGWAPRSILSNSPLSIRRSRMARAALTTTTYIPARTGADLSAQVSSGGRAAEHRADLPVRARSVAHRAALPEVWLRLGAVVPALRAAGRHERGPALPPRSFWDARAEIESAVHASVNHTIYEFGFAVDRRSSCGGSGSSRRTSRRSRTSSCSTSSRSPSRTSSRSRASSRRST